MQNAKLLLFSLLVASLGGVIYRPCLSSWIMLLGTLILILWQRHLRFFLMVIVLVMPFMIYFFHDARNLKNQAEIPDQKNVQLTGVIFPDNVSIDGDNLSSTATLDSGEAVKLYWTLPNKQSKEEWLKQDHVLTFSTTGDLTRIRSATNFNQFDSQEFYETKNMTHQFTVTTWQVENMVSHDILNGIRYQLHAWHSRAIHDTESLPKPLREYAQALILGVTPQALYGDNPGVQTLGLIHLFSVSGFHVSFLIMMIMALAKRLWITKEITIVLLSGLLMIYFVFAGEPAVLIRAIVAGELILWQDLHHHRFKSYDIWAISLLISLIFSPQILLTLGGQLSFLLTFCLSFAKKLSFWRTNLLMSVISFPLIVQQQFTWHILQTVVNIFAVPVFGTIIVPLVMLGYFGQRFPIIVDSANAIIHFFAALIDWLAVLPGNIVIGKIPELSTTLLIVFGFCMFCREKIIVSRARLIWLLLLASTILIIKRPLTGEFTTFDIGQGDAALIRTPLNHTVTVVDTGGQVTFGEKQSWQVKQYERSKGETVMVNYLHSLGIDTIDHLILTHHDQDHIGDAKEILRLMHVKKILMPAGMRSQQSFKVQILPYLKKTEVFEVTESNQVNDLPLHIYHPLTVGQAGNEDSIALYGVLGGMRVLTAGDLDRTGERLLAERHPEMRVDLVKLGHHGSRTSTDPITFSKWRPSIGIISAGRNNHYHHPHQETLETVQKNQMSVFNTQIHGMIKYVYRGKNGYFKVKLPHEF
ncbi:DNA internalization-related competence protein ComEC/Rec2 [Leuconostoc pseudomesenteroides]|uniref:DNA internalization-related competence protein ComEC/Rec2 n=1 Tax=Leuconostoc pseudomesenteroides TaxID=33968 RepID=UPI0039E954BA